MTIAKTVGTKGNYHTQETMQPRYSINQYHQNNQHTIDKETMATIHKHIKQAAAFFL